VELELAGNQAMHPLLAATMVKMVKDNGFKRLSFLCGVFFFFFFVCLFKKKQKPMKVETKRKFLFMG
jgi:hypothetical protein